MSDIIRKYPFITPDTVRQKTRMDQAFFDQHTPTDKGYDHINGTKYAGTVHNYGSEMLLETRNVKQRRPPIGNNVSLNSDLQFTFKLDYADESSTYDQECPFAISLRPNTLGNRRSYIVMEDCEPMYIPRPVANEDNAYSVKNLVWKTNTIPRMYVETSPGSGSFNYREFVILHTGDNNNVVEPTYWFHNTSSVNTPKLDDVSEEEREIMLNRMMIADIESYLDQGGKTKYRITSVDLESWIVDVPILWITLSSFKELPEFEMVNNVDKNGFPLFVPGISGSGEYFLYPFIYNGKENVPPASDDNDSCWAIRLFSTKSSTFETTSPPSAKLYDNLMVPLSRIQFVRYDPQALVDHGTLFPKEVFNNEYYYENIDITWSDSKVRLTVCDDSITHDESIYGLHRFAFVKMNEDDFEYDGILRPEIVYGFHHRYDQLPKDEDIESVKAYPIFKIHPIKYEIKDWSWLAKNGVSGVHVDYTTDYSENGIIKKNGTIFNYGDTDGLPPYFYYKMPRTIHRAHVELYLGHDSVSDPNNNVENEQFVSVIIDAGVPQTEIEAHIEDLNSAIIYRYNRLYYTDPEEVITEYNVVSDIGYVSRTLFGDVTMKDYKKCDRFIYHGHRMFSLGLMGLDPVLEYGRVYLTSNEDSEYKNNAEMGDPRPDRTVARICDIPTDINQLTSIKNVYPTLIIDYRYTRTQLNFTKDDRDRVLQIVNPGAFIRGYKDRPRLSNRLIYNSRSDLIKYVDQEYLTSKFPKYVDLDSTIIIDPWIDTTKDEQSQYGVRYKWGVADSDAGFYVGDVLKGYVGGRLIRGVVSRVSNDGHIREITDGGLFDNIIYDTTPIEIPISNLTSRAVYVELSLEQNISQYSSGVRAYVSFIINEEDYNNLEPHVDGCVDNIHALYKDDIGNLFITKWDLEESIWAGDYQITGPSMTYNIYDDAETRSFRTNNNVYIFRTMNNKVIVDAYNYSIAEPTGVSFNNVAYFYTAASSIEGNTYEDLVKDTINENHLLYNWAYYSTYDTDKDPEGLSTPTTYICMHDLYYNKLDSSSERQIYPSFNAYQGVPDTHLCAGLIFDNMTKGYISDTDFRLTHIKQPNVFIYNPLATMKNKYYEASSDILNYGLESYITYSDIDISLIHDNHSIVELARDVWKNTMYELEVTDDSSRCYRPNTVDDGDINTLPLRQIGKKGDVVAKYVGGKLEPVAEQPTGIMKPASARLYPMNYAWDKVSKTTSEIVYFFKIDDPSITNLVGFKMKDQYTNNDISYKSVILLNGKLYVYKNNNWITLKRYE